MGSAARESASTCSIADVTEQSRSTPPDRARSTPDADRPSTGNPAEDVLDQSQPDDVPDQPQADDVVDVGRIGPAHGVGGEVFVEPRTDQPELRFAPGARLRTWPPTAAPLTVEWARYQGNRFVVRFAGVADRAAAAALHGIRLQILTTDRDELEDPDEFYDSDLIGLQARSPAGTPIGPIIDVLHMAGGDYLLLDVSGVERMVPFVRAIVTAVDLRAATVIVDAPHGLFEL
ncbi:MAG: ribosome maturation factor RimM [Actinobacteria bacterium]|nr:ribosome maturation factor RimM [Actinomycetota bacterium]